MAAGRVIQRGMVEGKTYRVWERHSDGKKIVYVGNHSRVGIKSGTRHSMSWLRKRLKAESSEH